MNILHVNTVEHTGGAAKVMTRLLFKQRKEGHTVNVLIDGTHTLPMPIPGTDSCPRTAEEILAHPFVVQADVIHLHNLHGGNYFDMNVLPELTCRKKTVWTLHDMWALTGHCCHALDCTAWKTGCKHCSHLDYNERIDDDCAGNIYNHKKFNYDRADLTVITPCQWLLDLVKQSALKHFPAKRIPNALDTGVFKPVADKVFCKARLGLPKDKFIIGASASGGVLANGYKGGNYIREIVSRLGKSDVFFVDFGCEKEIREGNICCLPHVDDEQELALRYNALDISLHTPIAETFGLILLEFAACGVPIVGFATGGMPEQVVQGKTGYLFHNRNCEAVVNCIRGLMKDPAQVKQLGAQAREFAVQEFGMEKHYLQYMGAYND